MDTVNADLFHYLFGEIPLEPDVVPTYSPLTSDRSWMILSSSGDAPRFILIETSQQRRVPSGVGYALYIRSTKVDLIKLM